MKNNFQDKKFLVIQTASIGDVVLATSVLEKLHAEFPEAFLAIVVKKGCEELFHGHPFLNKIYVWDKSKNKYGNLWHLIRKIRKERFDCVINLHRFASSGIITFFSGAEIKTGFDKNPFSFCYDDKVKHYIGTRHPVHETERNHALLRTFVNGAAAPLRLYPTENDRTFVTQFTLKPYITIAPASLWFTKQYPEERWIEFIGQIPDTLNVFLIGSEKDRQKLERMKNAVNKKSVVNLAGRLSLLQTAALMQEAKMNFCNDSAPVHLASAMNAPVTVVFCSTVPEFGFGPLSENSAVIQTERKLACRPCGLHGLNRCRENTMECAYSIPVSKLMERIAL